ncbi:unnamed protein product, partial [Staurois parvus]
MSCQSAPVSKWSVCPCILLTTIHVITDWPISDHMIG